MIMEYSKTFDGKKTFSFKSVDPGEHGDLDRIQGEALTLELATEFSELMDLHYAAHQNSLLIVLQGMDTSGKDGLIRHLLSYVNPQSTRVIPFKVPTPEELGHDFLWRVHKCTPSVGDTAIFNRSHYEDVLVGRVHKLATDRIIERRYRQINAFEEALIDAGTIVLKFCLYISKDEQEQRLLDREKDPTKYWKLSVGDWQERDLWSKYEEAWEGVINNCSSKESPWHIIPANHKWYRTLAVTQAIVMALRPYRKEWEKTINETGKNALAAINAYRNSQ